VPERADGGATEDGGAEEDGVGESRRWYIGGRRRRLTSVFFLYCDKKTNFFFLRTNSAIFLYCDKKKTSFFFRTNSATWWIFSNAKACAFPATMALKPLPLFSML